MKRAAEPILGGALVLLFALRLTQVIGNIDAQTGFYRSPRLWLTLPAIAILAAGAAVAAWACKKRCAASSETAVFGSATFVLTCSAGLGIVYACLRTLIDIFRLHGPEHFFMSTRQLRILGFANGSFKAEAVLSVVGLAAAVWFMRFAMPRLKGPTGLWRSVWFALVPVVWYLARAIVVFITQPVNGNDTVALISIAASVSLAYAWFSVAQQVAFSPTEAVTRRLSVSAFACAAFCCCLSLPDIVLSLRVGAYTEAVRRVSDALSALAACCYARGILKTAKEAPGDVQP